jgi:hypothetical protein
MSAASAAMGTRRPLRSLTCRSALQGPPLLHCAAFGEADMARLLLDEVRFL